MYRSPSTTGGNVEVFAETELSQDRFLDGAVRLLQPKKGYRAGVDPVFLAASVDAKAGQSVLEFGCGAGQALLCLASRVSGLRLVGVELQHPYAVLARRNAEANGVALDIHEANLTSLPSDLRQLSFDHVIANPPYYRVGAHSPAQDEGRRTALGERTPLRDWISVAAKRLKPKGHLYMIQKADRLDDMIRDCNADLGSVEILPLAARSGREAELVIVRARKGGRAGLRLHAPVVLHEGGAHQGDGIDDQTPQARAVLRHGAALEWGAKTA